jgi:hypothetical protein
MKEVCTPDAIPTVYCMSRFFYSKNDVGFRNPMLMKTLQYSRLLRQLVSDPVGSRRRQLFEGQRWYLEVC